MTESKQVLVDVADLEALRAWCSPTEHVHAIARLIAALPEHEDRLHQFVTGRCRNCGRRVSDVSAPDCSGLLAAIPEPEPLADPRQALATIAEHWPGDLTDNCMGCDDEIWPCETVLTAMRPYLPERTFLLPKDGP